MGNRMTTGMFTSDDHEWTTPRWVYDPSHALFQFTVDAAASPANALCVRYFSRANSALIQPWGEPGERGLLNPPYGDEIAPMIEKVVIEARRGITIVALVPARTDTGWFRLIWDNARYVCFRTGRIAFLQGGVEMKSPAFPNALAIFSDRDWDLRSLEQEGWNFVARLKAAA